MPLGILSLCVMPLGLRKGILSLCIVYTTQKLGLQTALTIMPLGILSLCVMPLGLRKGILSLCIVYTTQNLGLQTALTPQTLHYSETQYILALFLGTPQIIPSMNVRSCICKEVVVT